MSGSRDVFRWCRDPLNGYWILRTTSLPLGCSLSTYASGRFLPQPRVALTSAVALALVPAAAALLRLLAFSPTKTLVRLLPRSHCSSIIGYCAHCPARVAALHPILPTASGCHRSV